MSLTLRSVTDFIFHSRLRAIGVAFAVTFIPLFGTVSILIAGLVTLRKGALAGFWVALAATLPYFILLPFQPMPLGLWVVGIISASNFFTWAFAVLLNRYGNWNLILELTALIGIIIVTTAHVAKPDLELWWGKQLSTSLSQILQPAGSSTDNKALNQPKPAAKTKEKVIKAENKSASAQEVSDPSLEPEVISFVNAAKPYATGVLTASLFFTALIQLFLARWWQLSLVNRDQLREEMQHIRLSPMAGFVFLSAIILSYLKIGLALDLLPVLYLSFSIAGLSLVHYAAGKAKPLGWLWLLVFYIILFVSWTVYHLPLAFQLIAMIALLDVWFDWRERLDRRFS